MNLETEYNSPKSAQPLTDNAEGENVRWTTTKEYK